MDKQHNQFLMQMRFEVPQAQYLIIAGLLRGYNVEDLSKKLSRKENTIRLHIDLLCSYFDVATLQDLTNGLKSGTFFEKLKKEKPIEKRFPEFYSLSPLQKQVVHAMARGQNPLVSVWPGSDFTMAEVQGAMRDVTLLCGTDDRAGILNYLYGDIDEERLSPWKKSLTPDEFSIVQNTLKGMSEKDIEQITGLKLREQKKIREGILDKIGADSMEGVFALAHGVRLLDPPVHEAREIHQNGLRALIGNGLEP